MLSDRLVPALLTLLLLALVAGCGGGGGDDADKQSGEESADSETGQETSTGASGDGRPKLRLVLHAPGDKKFESKVEAKAKEAVQLVADFGQSNPDGKAMLTIPSGPSSKLKIKGVVVDGPSKTATIEAPSGKKIGVRLVEYRCFVPPAKTFCPIKGTSDADGNAVIEADTKLAVRLGITLE